MSKSLWRTNLARCNSYCRGSEMSRFMYREETKFLGWKQVTGVTREHNWWMRSLLGWKWSRCTAGSNLSAELLQIWGSRCSSPRFGACSSNCKHYRIIIIILYSNPLQNRDTVYPQSMHFGYAALKHYEHVPKDHCILHNHHVCTSEQRAVPSASVNTFGMDWKHALHSVCGFWEQPDVYCKGLLFQP